MLDSGFTEGSPFVRPSEKRRFVDRGYCAGLLVINDQMVPNDSTKARKFFCSHLSLGFIR